MFNVQFFHHHDWYSIRDDENQPTNNNNLQTKFIFTNFLIQKIPRDESSFILNKTTT
jgi:hypothetical protein